MRQRSRPPRTNRSALDRPMGLVGWVCLSAVLSGCGSMAGVVAEPILVGVVPHVVAAMASAAGRPPPASEPSPQDPAVPAALEGEPIDFPIGAVFAALVRVAGMEGLEVRSVDEATSTLRVAHPASRLHGPSGGEITVTCTADGGSTRVAFKDDGRGAPEQVKALEARWLDSALKWLRQPGPDPGPGKTGASPIAAALAAAPWVCR